MNDRQSEAFSHGIGTSAELSLRVSVATLVRVVLEDPVDGRLFLALERQATRLDNKSRQVVKVKSQPFGGAIQLLDRSALQKRVGNFHFDSEESRREQDFRLFIRPADWEAVQQFCLAHLSQPGSILESDPTRELMEEFLDTMGIELKQDQYTIQVVGTIVEDLPSPTKNTHAMGSSTARIYRIFEARILDAGLSSFMKKKSETCSDHDLRQLAAQNFRRGGPGRANSVLTLPFRELSAAYAAISPEARSAPSTFQGHSLDETVAAVLDDVTVSKYRRL